MVFLALPAIAAGTGDNGLVKWAAVSTTAMAITGDVEISSRELVMHHRHYRLILVREIDKSDLKDVGKIVSAEDPNDARLYKVKISATVRLRNGNNICGPNDADWILVVDDHENSGPDLALAFFAGDNEPNLDYRVVANGHALCGTYGYERSN